MPASNLHEYILEALEDEIDSHAVKQHMSTYNNNTYTMLSILFQNYRCRNNVHTGLRLTAIGNRLMKTQFDHYTYDLDEYVNKTIVIALDRNMKWPYYVTSGKVTFYSRDDAAWFTLNGSNLKDFTDVI